MKVKIFLLSVCLVNICNAKPDLSGVVDAVINVDNLNKLKHEINYKDKFVENVDVDYEKILRLNYGFAYDNNSAELQRLGFDVVVDESDRKIEIPMSRPRNVLKLIELLIAAVIDMEENAEVSKQMSELSEHVSGLLKCYDKDFENEFCEVFEVLYKQVKKLSQSLKGRTDELSRLFENLMFFIRVSAYTVKINRYFEKHENELLKCQNNLKIDNHSYDVIDIPPSLLHGVSAKMKLKRNQGVGKSGGGFVVKNELGGSVDVGYDFGTTLEFLKFLSAEFELKKTNEEVHLNFFSIASLQEDIWSSKNYLKFKKMLTELLIELSSLKANLYNLNSRLKTIGIIRNDLSYYFDRGLYTTEYIRSFCLGSKVNVKCPLLDSIGVEASVYQRISRHKRGAELVPDNIRNYGVILNNKDYALSLVKMFNSGRTFSKVLNGDSYLFKAKNTSKGIYSVSDVLGHMKTYLTDLIAMYRQDDVWVKHNIDRKHKIEKDLGVHRRKEFAELFAQILAYFCFTGKDFNGNPCSVKELTTIKDCLVGIIDTLDDSRSMFAHRRKLRTKRAFSSETTTNICFGKMINLYGQLNMKKPRIYDNGYMASIDVNAELLCWLNELCISKIAGNEDVRKALGNVISKVGDLSVSDVFFKITDKLKDRMFDILQSKDKLPGKYTPLWISFFSNSVDNLKEVLSDNCKILNDKTPLRMLTDITPKTPLVKVHFVAHSMEETAPIMTMISSIPGLAKKDGRTILKKSVKTFINTLTVYELVKDFIKHAMEYEANHGVAVSLDVANKFVDKYKFIDGLVKSAQIGRLNGSYKKYANATKHKTDFVNTLKNAGTEAVKKELGKLVYHYYLDKAKPFFEASFK